MQKNHFMRNISFFIKFLIISFATTAIVSCDNTNNKVITNRIQYDVDIQSTDESFDWWIQNIEGQSREELIQQIFKQVLNGQVVAYDFLSYNPMGLEDLKGMIKQVDTISVESPFPPYELIDTVIVREMHLKDITRLRFLEEWSYNPKTLNVSKKTIGICPLLRRYSESGDLRGYRPLFWIFFDKSYPNAFKVATK